MTGTLARTIDHQKRTEIARRALQVIRVRGVHRTTMSDIAKALEMKRPALYHYFPNLTAICHEVLAILQDRIRNFVVARMAAHRHPIDQLEAVLEASMALEPDIMEDQLVMFQLFAVAETSDREALAARGRDLYLPNRAFLIALMKNGIERGVVAPCNAEGVVDMVLTLTEGTQVYRVLGHENFQPMADFVRNQVLEPLRLKKEEPK